MRSRSHLRGMRHGNHLHTGGETSKAQSDGIGDRATDPQQFLAFLKKRPGA